MCEDDNTIVYVMFVVVYNLNRKTLLPVIPRESGGLISFSSCETREKKSPKKWKFLILSDEIFYVKFKGAWLWNATDVAKWRMKRRARFIRPGYRSILDQFLNCLIIIIIERERERNWAKRKRLYSRLKRKLERSRAMQKARGRENLIIIITKGQNLAVHDSANAI